MEELIKGYAETLTDDSEMLAVIEACGEDFTDDTAESGYFNVKIPTADGQLRVYRKGNEKGFRFQHWKKSIMSWSGIPVFNPSGRDNLKVAF